MRRLGVLVLPVLLFLTAATSASASPILQIQQGAYVVTIGDSNGDGIVAFAGSVGTYQVNLTFGASASGTLGTSEYAALDLLSGNATGTGGTLSIILSDTDYLLPSSSVMASANVVGALAAPLGGSLTFQSWLNGQNLTPPPSSPTVIPAGSTALFTPTASFSYSPFACVSCSFEQADSTSLTYSGGPFSLFSQAIISLNGFGTVAFNHNVQVTSQSVPEPASVALFGTALLAAAAASRRRLRRRGN